VHRRLEVVWRLILNRRRVVWSWIIIQMMSSTQEEEKEEINQIRNWIRVI